MAESDTQSLFYLLSLSCHAAAMSWSARLSISCSQRDRLLRRNDIRIAKDIAHGDEEKGMENFQQMRSGQARSTDVKLDYSLRQYVSVLYKVPS